MAFNPAKGSLTPRQAGTLRMNSQNDMAVSTRRKKNEFNLSRDNYLTLRFGEVQPFFVENGIPRDEIELSNSHVLYSHTLQSPLLSNLTMYKDYFYVPMKAILPHSYDAWKNTPVQGDDVPSDVYCNWRLCQVVTDANRNLKNMYSQITSSSSPITTASDTYLRYLCSLYLTIVNMCSTDSLLHKLRIVNFAPYFKYRFNATGQRGDTFDSLLEANLSSDNPDAVGTVNLYLDGNYDVLYSFTLYTSTAGKFDSEEYRRLYDFLLRNYTRISLPSVDSTKVGTLKLLANIFIGAITYDGENILDGFPAAQGATYDVSPLIAYQMIGAQFYVNDAVDSIYNSFDWMQDIWSMYLDKYRTLSSTIQQTLFYDYNGHKVEYDVFSEHVFNSIQSSLSEALDTSITEDFGQYLYMRYMLALLLPFESLRYGDYFTGGRVSPLAVGDVTAPVVSGEVSAVNMTHATLWQKFLQKINKAGPTPWLQQTAVYGAFPSTVDEMPRFIARERFRIGKQEIENTAENQGTLQTNLRDSSGSGYSFDVDLSDDCVLLGLVSFDCPRVYENNVSRLAYVRDRYDVFQPDFQNVGDQAVILPELNFSTFQNPGPDGLDNPTDYGQKVFAWTLRNTEYKQKVSEASGGFVGQTFLPSWAFTTDNSQEKNINSDFLRNHNLDFDRFYKSLQNVSPAGYFHFVVKFTNTCKAWRAMQTDPQILF